MTRHMQGATATSEYGRPVVGREERRRLHQKGALYRLTRFERLRASHHSSPSPEECDICAWIKDCSRQEPPVVFTDDDCDVFLQSPRREQLPFVLITEHGWTYRLPAVELGR